MDSNTSSSVSARPVILYGGAFSLYTGRARSYFIKAGIDYRE